MRFGNTLGKKCLVVHAHPLPSSFNTALRDVVVESLSLGKREVISIDLYEEGFRPELSIEEKIGHLNSIAKKPLINDHTEKLQWADHLILVHPTWWGGAPAMLKGWFDRVWVNEVAFTLPPGKANIKGLLSNIRRISVVTTHGSGPFRNRLQGLGSKRTPLRGLRLLCHKRCQTDWLAMYYLDRSDLLRRDEFLERVRKRFS
jgi:NAD(P)H dehydrogenase (quinone)